MASKDLTYLNTEGPFDIYDKRKLKEPVDSLEEYKKSVLKAIEGYDKKQKKPVRFNFFKDNEGLFRLSQTIDPFLLECKLIVYHVSKLFSQQIPTFPEFI